ncbi:MAG: (d)CMP kinase [Bdellovibrionales bacterium]|nr:(d)CMP kinase [Bdellovibrionales bacterium]
MNKKHIVTIDGPAASGKSSVSRDLAAALGWEWLSTGAFYRGLAFVAKATKTSLYDESSLAQLATSSLWKIQTGKEKTHVFFEGADVSESIYKEDVGDIASKISHYPAVRKALLAAQRSFGETQGKGLVAEGRDCGTVIFPQANIKVYLTARSDHRAQRRAKELGGSAEEVLKAQKIRDSQDTSRAAAPLQVPENAEVIDTSELKQQQVVDKILQMVKVTIPLDS